ncbi:MAG: S8 family serine peptidase, partial [Bacteroidota bacterium]
DVIDFAYAQGALVVAAASNDNDDNDVTSRFPAGYDRVLSVGATNKANDGRASFSNYGRTVDVFAPGVTLNSTTINGAYNDFANGTSFSAPMVAGLAALIQTQNPAWSVDRVREQIRVTADPIEGSNPSSFAGRLGQGRINALRALTESGSPAIRPIGVAFEEVSGDGDEGIEDGETYRVTVRLTNYLASANNVTVRLSAADNVLSILNTTATLASLASGDTASVAFSFRVDDAPDDFDARFITDITSGSYTDTEMFTATLNPADFEPLDTGTIRTALLANGNFGWGHFAGSSPGEGFVVDGRNLLFEGGLMVGVAANRVSNNIRSGTEADPDGDFEAGSGQEIVIAEPGGTTFQEGSVIIEDNLAENPIGIEVEHTIFADTSAANRDFVILRYTIINSTTAPLNNVHAGVFADWDLSDNAADDASYDAARRLGIVQDNAAAPAHVVGMRLLTDDAAPAFEAVSNPGMIYDDFTDAEKWGLLSGGIGARSQSGIDVSLLLGAGPFSLDPGCSMDMAVALVGGDAVSNVAAASDQAQRLWDEQIEVLRTNTAPRFTTAVPDTSIMPGVTINIPLQATDADTCDDLTFNLEAGPPDARVDAQTGMFTYAPETSSNLGSFPVTVAVTDGRRSATLDFTIHVLVNASQDDERPVHEVALEVPFPNPAAESVTLNYAVPVVTALELRVFDVLGRTVRVLAQGAVAPGRHTLTWSGRDAEGAPIANGLYVLRLVATAADGHQQVREQTLVWAR